MPQCVSKSKCLACPTLVPTSARSKFANSRTENYTPTSLGDRLHSSAFRPKCLTLVCTQGVGARCDLLPRPGGFPPGSWGGWGVCRAALPSSGSRQPCPQDIPAASLQTSIDFKYKKLTLHRPPLPPPLIHPRPKGAFLATFCKDRRTSGGRCSCRPQGSSPRRKLCCKRASVLQTPRST